MDTVAGFLQSGFSAVVPFIILLGILIFVHELGHFAVAKWCGVRVEVFSLGFGKKILSHKRGDTTYCISLIPLGGYVKMFGDELGAKLPEEMKKFSFIHKSVAQRIAIVLAGPLMNFFFAALIFAALAGFGEDFRKPILGDISFSSEAYKAGFRAGDEILRVNGVAVVTWEDLIKELSANHSRKAMVDLRRFESQQAATIEVVPQLKPNPNLLSLESMVGDIEGINTLSKGAVVGVRDKSVASKMGLKTGDKIIRIQEKEIRFFRDLENTLIALQGMEISFQIERGLNPGAIEKMDLVAKVPSHSSLRGIGIESPELYLYSVVEGSPAQKAGLKRGDRLLQIDDKKLESWEDILQKVKSYAGPAPLLFEVEREGGNVKLEIAPEMTKHMTHQGAEEKRFTVGISPWIIFAQPDLVKVRQQGLWAATQRGFDRTWEVSGMTIMGFLRLIQNKISPKNIGGVISIGQAASETFKIGWSQFFHMMAIISVNLFILNLLPIPVLDGGHLLFFVIEALRGAPISMRKLEIAQQMGLVVLMSLMVFALFNDFSRIFGFW